MRIALVIALASLASPALAGNDLIGGHEELQRKEKFPDAKKAFDQARATLMKDYFEEVSEEQLYRGALTGMLKAAGYRDWDTLIGPTEYATLHHDLSGQISGIGVELDWGHSGDGAGMTVIGTLPDSPAERAGIKAGDRILRVDDKPVRSAPEDLHAAARAITGKPGTKVTLTLLRDDQVLQKTITRATVTFAAVNDAMLPDGVGLIWVRSFNEKTPELLRQSLQRLGAKKLRGLVFDLRHNEGGLFDKMVECAGQVLPKGSTVTVEMKRGKREEAIKTESEPLFAGAPVTVLIDNSTASGAELFAAALRDVLGARLVGGKTHGKFNVQKIEELGNGWAIKYTVGVFKTPKGLMPDGKGLDPDVPVDADERSVTRAQRLRDPAARLQLDAQLRAALALLPR